MKKDIKMAIKELKKDTKMTPIKIEKDVEKFISKGGGLAATEINNSFKDHRLTLRIPQTLLNKIDKKRKERIGTISRNLWILELIDKATNKF